MLNCPAPYSGPMSRPSVGRPKNWESDSSCFSKILQAEAAIQLGERGFVTAEQLAGGGVRCEWPTKQVSSGGGGGTIAADLRIVGGRDGGGRSVTMAAASGVGDNSSSAPVGGSRINANARGRGAESEGGARH